jgi:pyruvate dehydrogenase E1 component
MHQVEKSMSTPIHDQDVDQQETLEWLEAIEGVLQADGADRAHFLLEQMIDKLRRSGANLPHSSNTAYVNTIPTHLQPIMPGDRSIERRIGALIRWNAAAMVVCTLEPFLKVA